MWSCTVPATIIDGKPLEFFASLPACSLLSKHSGGSRPSPYPHSGKVILWTAWCERSWEQREDISKAGLDLNETPSFKMFSVCLLASYHRQTHSLASVVFPWARASSASPMEFITRGSAWPGLQQHSRLLSHHVNSARPSRYLHLLDCVCVSVFLGWGCREDEPNTKPSGIRKIVPEMLKIPSGNLAVWHRGWISVQCVWSRVSESYSDYLPTLSLPFEARTGCIHSRD